MKAILEFDLPEDQDEYHTANYASNYYRALWEFGNKYLRDKLKYHTLTPEEQKIYEEVREKFWEILRDEDIAEDF